MPTTRTLVIIVAAGLCAGGIGFVAIRDGASDDSASVARPASHRSGPRAERPASVWEQAAAEQAAYEEAARLASIRKTESEQAAREQAELELAANRKTEVQQDVLDKLVADRAARVESALAETLLGQAERKANENAAVATLRSIASAQAQFQAAAVIDTDADGKGEHGFLAELAGTVPTRQFDPQGPIIGEHPIDPPVLSTSMGQVKDGGSGEGAIERSGYLFKVYLPDSEGAGVAEAVTGGATDVVEGVDADLSERRWCAYGWPVTTGESGTRAFFISELGEVLQHTNAESDYSGTESPPGFSAAFAEESLESPAARGWTSLD